MIGVLVAICSILAILVLVDLALTVAIVRRIKNAGLGSSRDEKTRSVGLKVDLERDASPWDVAMQEVESGTALVAFVSTQCEGCRNFSKDLQEMDEAPAFPIHIVLDGTIPASSDDVAIVSEWRHVASVHMSPIPFDQIQSFDPIRYVPGLFLLSEGVIVATGARLIDVYRTPSKISITQPALHV